LQLIGKISLEFNFSSSLLLYYGPTLKSNIFIKMLLRCRLVEAITSMLGAVKKHIYLPTLLLQVNCSDVHRALQYCFGLLDLIRNLEMIYLHKQ